MKSKTYELAQACKRYSESCLYTSTAFFGWLKFLRVIRAIFIIVPLALGSVAGGNLLVGIDEGRQSVILGVCAFVAGVIPAIYAALGYDQMLDKYAVAAGEFKNLQDAFRRCALVSSKKSFSDFEADSAGLIARLERVRADSITPPEWIFKRAQKKVKSGDYTFDLDLEDDAEPPSA